MPFARVRDIDVYWERHGAGEPLLFISGTGGDLRVKPNLFDGPIAKAFDVLSYDQRGLGRTSKPDADYTMADYADDAAGLLDAVGWGRVKVIGVSFGGMVAQEFVLRHPGRVSRLVLACTSPGGAGGASFPFHTIDHLKGEARAKHLIPVSDTRHSARRSFARNSTRISPPLPSKAWRAALVTSSFTITPSNQHCSEGSCSGHSDSTSATFLRSSRAWQIAWQSRRRQAAASHGPPRSGNCNTRCTTA